MNVNWPFGGLSDLRGEGEQAPGTSRELINVRGFDPASGRLRGGTRDGTEKAFATSSASPIREIQQVNYAPALFTYSQAAQGAATEEWKVTTPLRSDCRAVARDAANNVYALDGRAGVAKYNSEGKLVWKFVLPVKSKEHVCRALAVDDEGAVYVAVSEGYPQKDGRIWKYRVRDSGDSVPNKEWEVAIDGYIEQMRLRGGYLYCAANYPDQGKSAIVVYRLIDTSVPEIAWTRTQVPYPTNGIAVRAKDGAIATCHEANTTRSYDPRSPDTTKIAIDWTPDRLDSWTSRAWALLDASDIDGDGRANSAYKNGDPVLLWTDLTGNDRNAYDIETLTGTAVSNCSAPSLNKSKALAGQDTVLFSNPVAGFGNSYNALITPGNPSIAASVGGAQRSLLPAYTDAYFCVFMVLRTSDTTNSRCALSQNYSTSTYQRAVCTNTTTAGGAGFTTSSGFTALHQSITGGAATGSAGPYGAYDTSTGFSVVSFSCYSDGTSTGGGSQNINSVNGTDCTNESFKGFDLDSIYGSQLGKSTTTTTNSTSTISGLYPFDGEIAYILVLRDYVSGSKTLITDAEFEKVEGYLHWRFGVAHKLPAGHTYASAPPTFEGLPAATTTSPYLYLTDTEQMLVKWDPNNGKTRWVVKDSSTSTEAGIGGLGYAVEWPANGADDLIFSHGPLGTSTAFTSTDARRITRISTVRRIKDNGDTASTTGSGTWEDYWGTSTSPTFPDYHYPRMTVSGISANSDPTNPDTGTNEQAFGIANLYVPVHTSTTGGDAVYMYLGAGNQAGNATPTDPSRTFAVSTGSRGYAVAVPGEIPEYSPALLSSLSDERMFVGTPKEGSSDEAVLQVRLVDSARATVAPRTVYVANVTSSTIRREGSPASSGLTLATTGYVSMCSLYSKIYGTDGATYFEIDPRVSDGIVRKLKPTLAGQYPKKAQLFAAWNQRLVMGRGVDPHQVFMAGVGDPRDADTLPAEKTGFEAVTLPVDAPVTTFIPISDDLLLIGTAGSVHRQTGDPAQGGRLDRIADLYGVPFGEPWCKDDSGNVFVFMSHGGVSRFSANGKIESISDKNMKRRFEAIDLTTYRVRLVWSDGARGMHLFQCPITEGAIVPHYFWESETGAWYQDDLPYQVYSARSIDKDGSGNRAVWIGCSDGYVRRFTGTVNTDDGSPIYGTALMGPLAGTNERYQYLFKRPQITMGLGSANVGFHVSDSAFDPGSAVSEQPIVMGQNERIPVQARGNHVWLRIFGTGRWSFESAQLDAVPAGIRRRL